MSGAAQRIDGTGALDYDGADGVAVEAPATESGLKQAVTERLAAHRNKRAAEYERMAELNARQGSGSPSRRGSSRIREAVAARYQQTQSYREFLAAEAERALQQAQAEAEVAARNARAVADAKMQLMEELDQWNRTETHEEIVREIVREERKVEVRGELAHALADIALGADELIREERFEAEQVREPAGLSVQMYEDVAAPTVVSARRRTHVEDVSVEELAALEEEIAFRRAPDLGKFLVEAEPIPGNVIEFPRQLVAPRKARPRLAEGPLREDAPAEPQLRIFEVDAEQISAEPVVAVTAAPEWQSLLLEARTEAIVTAPLEAQAQFTLQPQTASIERRLMAAAVDAVCVAAGMAGFAAVVVEVAGRNLQMLPKPMLGAVAGVALLVLYVAYQMLFFTLKGDTPGMRYARIGLCTFGDRNPSRKAMRRRVLATLLAVCPLGLGLAWACLDDEKLGWHDRMSRMYQRAY
jgi:uncharacterized RDD family membrane protein YckC